MITFLSRDEEGDVNSKDFIQTANLIVEDSDEVVKIATQVAKLCTDTQLENVSCNSMITKIYIEYLFNV